MCKSEGVIEDDINQLFIAIIHFVIARVEKYLLHHITIYLYSCLVTFLRVSFFIEACLEHKLGSSVSAITLMFVLHNPVLNLSSVPTLNYIILSFLYNINLSFIFCMSSLQRKKKHLPANWWKRECFTFFCYCAQSILASRKSNRIL